MKIINALFVALLLTGILGLSAATVMAEEVEEETGSWYIGGGEQE
jgi:hypothetical protein